VVPSATIVAAVPMQQLQLFQFALNSP
jgi:hypothetical protein